MLTKKASCDGNIDVVTFDVEDGRVKSMRQGVKFGEEAFLDYAVIERELLLELLDSFAAVDHLDLFEALNSEYGRFRVAVAEFDGYMKPIFDKASYFKANMDLLDPEVLSELADARPIKTKAHDNPPAKYEPGCKVSNSLVASGDRIFGSVSGFRPRPQRHRRAGRIRAQLRPHAGRRRQGRRQDRERHHRQEQRRSRWHRAARHR